MEQSKYISVEDLTYEQCVAIIRFNERGNETLEDDDDLESLQESVRGYLDNEDEDESGETFAYLMKNALGKSPLK